MLEYFLEATQTFVKDDVFRADSNKHIKSRNQSDTQYQQVCNDRKYDNNANQWKGS